MAPTLKTELRRLEEKLVDRCYIATARTYEKVVLRIMVVYTVKF